MRITRTTAAAAAGAAALLLSLAGPAGAAPADVAADAPGGGGWHRVGLDGEQEVPGPGDPDGNGVFRYEIKKDRLCYRLSVADIDPPTAAHLHFGPAGETGPVAVVLRTPGEDGTSGGCIRARADQTPENAAEVLTRWELRGIEQDPFFFYVNVHNEEFPDGAVRGQL
ncbi:CHRD domain-containing protein [Streptomyces sp. WMMB 714]|uniref:CHRD domain-containing protein n=1 Tax=Streptomyces sp. WMMB 714 TaxID=1286822 RepID=UPI00069670A8|nr:CHRD domain-containing protein [Streptomyces sp. WMMB 714]SCK25076.1 CHRD domain-containing protein [Streptomyces sp. WMMB 714]